MNQLVSEVMMDDVFWLLRCTKLPKVPIAFRRWPEWSPRTILRMRGVVP